MRKFIFWLKNIFKKFVFDSGLFDKGFDLVVESVVPILDVGKDKFIDCLEESLMNKFKKYPPIKKAIDIALAELKKQDVVTKESIEKVLTLFKIKIKAIMFNDEKKQLD